MLSKDSDAPLSREGVKMVEHYRKYRDVYKAAERAHVPKNQAVKLFNSPAFQDELERQEEAVRMERARQEVRDEKLTNETIDRELLQVMLLSAEKHGSLKLEAIRLAGVMVGRIQAGNSRALDPQGSGGGGPAQFYQALVQVQEAAPIMPEPPAAAAAAAAVSSVLPLRPVPAAPAAPPAPAAPAVKPQASSAAQPAKSSSGVIRLG